MTKNKYKEKLMNLCAHTPPLEFALEWLEKITPCKKRILFGGGQLGSYWIDIWRYYKIEPDYICDNNMKYWGKQIKGVMCISPGDLLNMNTSICIMIAVRNHQPIRDQLLHMGIPNENILIASTDTMTVIANYTILKEMNLNNLCRNVCTVMDACEDVLSSKILFQTLKRYLYNQNEAIDYTGESYFIPELPKRENESFVDVGAFDGDTLESFLKSYKESFNKYYAFEIDKINYQKLCDKVSSLPDTIKSKILLYEMGLWSQKKEISYSSNNTSTTITSSASTGDCKGIVDRLDCILKGKEVTFIKMDIEGAEIEALKGCAEHIQNYRPILAICIYHSVNDLIRIPLMLKEFGYKIIIRHHDINANEIVCYAFD